MSRPTVAELRPIDLFDGVDDEHLAEIAARAELRDCRAGRGDRRGGRERPPACILLLDGTAETFRELNGAPGVLGRPRRADLARRDRGADRLGARRAGAGQDRRAARRRSTPRSSSSWRSRTARSCGACSSGCGRSSGGSRRSSRTASAWSRSARWPPGSRTSSTTPPSAAKRASAELADALEVLGSTIGVFVESGVSREQAEQLVADPARRARGLPRAGVDLPARARRRRRRADAARSKTPASPTPTGSSSRSRRPASTSGSSQRVARARRARRPRRPCAGSPRRCSRASWPPSWPSRPSG